MIEASSDADFANALSFKSVSGNMLMMYRNCAFWRSKGQAVIAGDTTAAELIAMSSAGNEWMWLKQLSFDPGLNVYMPTLWGDNKSANLLAENPVYSDRSNHIHVRHLRVTDAAEMEEIAIDWIGTSICWQTV